MRYRNFLPLAILLLAALPLGLIFLFVWESQTLVLCAMQLLHLLIMFLTYRAGINSARKNFEPPLELGKIVFLPLKVNLALYLVIGIPVVLTYAANSVVLMIAYSISLAGFSLAYLSGVTYVARSGQSHTA